VIAIIRGYQYAISPYWETTAGSIPAVQAMPKRPLGATEYLRGVILRCVGL